MNKGIRVAEESWPTVEAALSRGAIAVLPIGASSKEHGRHLPMSTDYIQAEWLVSQLILHLDIVAWPTLSYGYYPAFLDYPGSSSLQEDTFEKAVEEIIQNIIANESKNIFILNTGISTILALEKVVEITSKNVKLQLINVYSGDYFVSVENQIKQQTHGSHADEIETSIMLAIAPHTVNMQLAEANELEKHPGPLSRTNRNDPNYSPSGVYGDATLATKEKGKMLIDAMLKDVLTIIRT